MCWRVPPPHAVMQPYFVPSVPVPCQSLVPLYPYALAFCLAALLVVGCQWIHC